MKLSKKEVKLLHGMITALVGEYQHKFTRKETSERIEEEDIQR